MGDFWTSKQPNNYTFQESPIEFNSQESTFMNVLQESPVSRYDGKSYMSGKNTYRQFDNFEDEPPLLEELEIEPDKILKRMLLVLDPFTSSVYLEEYDLMGPLILFFLLPSILLFSAKAYFSHVCGFGVVCSIFMWSLLYLMSARYITLSTVASILGYGLLPQILLATVGIIMPLYSIVGFILALVCILWSSFATSRIFVVMMNSSDNQHKLLLIAYPCALLYAVFSLLVVF